MLEQWIDLTQWVDRQIEKIKPLNSNEEWERIFENEDELPQQLFLLMKEAIEKFKLVSGIYWFGSDKAWKAYQFEIDAQMYYLNGYYKR